MAALQYMFYKLLSYNLIIRPLYICSITTKLFISSNKARQYKDIDLSDDELNCGCNLGLDSHADTLCAGQHVRVLEYIDGRECVVQPFNDGYKPIKNIGIVNGALAYDVGNGETYILLLNQALDFCDSMEHLLLLVNQAQHNNVVIDNISPHLDYYERSKYEMFSQIQTSQLSYLLQISQLIMLKLGILATMIWTIIHISL